MLKSVPSPGRQFTLAELRSNAAMRAPLTNLAYASDLKVFRRWCILDGCSALPAATHDVCRYITEQLNSGRKVTTVGRYMTAIRAAHRDAGLESPHLAEMRTLITAAKRIRREQPVQKEPVTLDQLRRICAQTGGTTLLGVRNRAIILLGFASSLRRSNLAALDLADLRFEARGLVVHVRCEKQDQFGVGRILGVLAGRHPETCALRALRAWLELRGSAAGPVFVGVNNGALTGRRLHPARIGFVGAAVEANVNWLTIMETTGHRSIESLRRYYRCQDPLRAAAAAHIDM